MRVQLVTYLVSFVCSLLHYLAYGFEQYTHEYSEDEFKRCRSTFYVFVTVVLEKPCENFLIAIILTMTIRFTRPPSSRMSDSLTNLCNVSES